MSIILPNLNHSFISPVPVPVPVPVPDSGSGSGSGFPGFPYARGMKHFIQLPISHYYTL